MRWSITCRPTWGGAPGGGTWAGCLHRRHTMRRPIDERAHARSMTCGTTWDDVHAGASVAGNDAPRIGERAASRGRGAAEGGNECAGLKGAIRSRSNFLAVATPHRPSGSDEGFAPAAASFAGNNAPLIGERAPQRGGVARRGGGDEHAGTMRPRSVRAPACGTLAANGATRDVRARQ